AARSRPSHLRRAPLRPRYCLRHAPARAHRRACAARQDHPLHLPRARGYGKSLLARHHALSGKDCRERRSRPSPRPHASSLARADLPPTRPSGRCGRDGPRHRRRHAGGVMGSLGLLARHFFGRFFDNEIVSQNSDMRTNVVQMIGLVATPGMFVPFYMIPQRTRFDQPFLHNWILLSDYYFFVLYSMVVMGFVMVFEWDAIFPDRKDYIILTPLPLSGGAIFTRKTLALIAFLGLFLLDANFFCTLLGPLVSGGQGTGAPIVWKLIAVHAAAVGGGGVFVVLSIASIQGVLINLLPGRAFRRISPWVQMTVMGLLIVVLFLTPLMCASIRPLVEHRSPLLRWFPPFWFLSLYLDMLPGQPAGPLFHQIAPLATQGLTLAFALFAITYLAGYHRHARRVMEGVDVAPNGPSRLRAWFDGAVNRCLLLHPLERATFHFISNT